MIHLLANTAVMADVVSFLIERGVGDKESLEPSLSPTKLGSTSTCEAYVIPSKRLAPFPSELPYRKARYLTLRS